MSGIVIVAIVFGSLIVMQYLKMVERERANRPVEGSSVTLSELEDRIEQIVQSSLDPIRDELASLRGRIRRESPELRLPPADDDRAGEAEGLEDAPTKSRIRTID